MSSRLQSIEAQIRELRSDLRSLASRAELYRVVEGDNGLAQVQSNGPAAATDDDVEIFGTYGMEATPPPGTEAVLVNVGAAADHPVVIANAAREKRPTDHTVGDVSVYTDADRHRTHMKAAERETDVSADKIVVSIKKPAGGIGDPDMKVTASEDGVEIEIGSGTTLSIKENEVRIEFSDAQTTYRFSPAEFLAQFLGGVESTMTSAQGVVSTGFAQFTKGLAAVPGDPPTPGIIKCVDVVVNGKSVDDFMKNHKHTAQGSETSKPI